MKGMLVGARGAEELARRALFAALIRFTNRERRPEERRLRDRPFRVLFIAEDAIGDTILALPAIRAVAESHPDTVVDVATSAGPAEVLRHSPFIRRFIVFPRHDRRRLNAWVTVRRYGPYDVIVDGMLFRCHVRSRSLAMMIASGARYWVGEGGRGGDYLLNVVRPFVDDETPHLTRMLSLVAPFLSRAPRLRPLLTLTTVERAGAEKSWSAHAGAPRVLVNLSTRGPDREWPEEHFATVTRHIRCRCPEARLIVVGLDRDRAMMDRVARAAGAEALDTTIRELVALVAASDMVVSPDTAVCHMASAFERPLVSIHIAGMRKFRPHDTPGVRIVGSSPVTMRNIPVQPVLDAVDDVLIHVSGPAIEA
ncbi:MAG TPA: glycosyltransferase family 9 protein [Gemmatimonadaceae bacterium]